MDSFFWSSLSIEYHTKDVHTLADYSQTKKRASQEPGVYTTNDFTSYDYSKISAQKSTSNT